MSGFSGQQPGGGVMQTSNDERFNVDAKVKLRKQAALLSVSVGLALFFLKGLGYWLTGSTAVLSDAMESVVHVLATGFAFYSVILSARPADRTHPYGHGKIEFFSAGFEGGLIVLAALSIIYVAVPRLVDPPDLPHLDLGLLITALVGVVNLWLGWHLIRVGKKNRSLTLVADGRHVLTDSYTSLGVVLGLGLVFLTGWNRFDPICAILVAGNIIVTGAGLMRQSIGGLMDEADPDLIAQVTGVLDRHRRPEWIDVHRLRCWKSGDSKHLDFHLTLPFYLNVAQAHQVEMALESHLREALEGPLYLLIHHDPCMPSCCSFCTMNPCSQRQHPLVGPRTLQADEVIKNASYQVMD